MSIYRTKITPLSHWDEVGEINDKPSYFDKGYALLVEEKGGPYVLRHFPDDGSQKGKPGIRLGEFKTARQALSTVLAHVRGYSTKRQRRTLAKNNRMLKKRRVKRYR